jgi:hypothetical protein
MVTDFIKEAFVKENFLRTTVQSLWQAVTMKFGLGKLAIAAVLVTTSQAQCPDYTSYSQVSIL